MKKFLILLSVIIPALAFVACSSDDDMPDVNIEVTFDNAIMSDGTLYVVQGEDFEVSGIKVTNNETGKAAGLSAANYYWDRFYVGTSVQPPYTFEFELGNTVPVGNHLLEIQGTLLAVDKAPAFALISNDVVVVADESDLPEATGPATITIKASVSNTSK